MCWVPCFWFLLAANSTQVVNMLSELVLLQWPQLRCLLTVPCHQELSNMWPGFILFSLLRLADNGGGSKPEVLLTHSHFPFEVLLAMQIGIMAGRGSRRTHLEVTHSLAPHFFLQIAVSAVRKTLHVDSTALNVWGIRIFGSLGVVLFTPIHGLPANNASASAVAVSRIQLRRLKVSNFVQMEKETKKADEQMRFQGLQDWIWQLEGIVV